MVDFVVCENDMHPILGLTASQDLKILRICDENFERVNMTREEANKDEDTPPIGTFPGYHTLRLVDGAQPKIMPSRRIPIAIKTAVKAELDRMTEMKIIEPVSEPTPWVSQMVVVKKKNNALRICIDPCELNKVTKRERYPLPVLEDVMHELSESKVFSKADLKNGYWHVQLDTESSYLTTFQTSFGRYRWLRLPFGLNVSAEIFQRKLHETLADLEGVVNVADDIIIYGRNTDEHDKRLSAFLKRCDDWGIQLNKEKLITNTNSVNFMGHIISASGLQMDPEKDKAIQNFPIPQNTTELKRFLGMINYLNRFVPNAATHAQPLQNLLKNDVKWNWSEAQNKSFETLKGMITNATKLAIYDQTKDLVLENDASDYGLGATIRQDGHPIAFASRQMNESERRYAQIEKEMLALVFGLTKFHHYTYGRRVTVITDHQPLVSITKKPLDKAPRRLRSMLLHIQEYDFDLIYKPGRSIPVADALSRAPIMDESVETISVVSNLALTPITKTRLEQLRAATETDENTNALKNLTTKGWPAHKEQVPNNLRPYFCYRDELTVQDGIIIRGDRLVIPYAMRSEMKKKLHAGHTGINSCLRRARQYVFWPGMSNEVRQMIETCDTCNAIQPKQAKDTLFLHDVPQRPWEKIGTDLLSYNGKTFLITVDYYSNFFELNEITHESSQAVVKILKEHFARHGIPDVVISDNGPQFASQIFQQFSKEWEFSHETSSPWHSQANGAAEAAVKVAKRLLTKCQRSGEDFHMGLLNLRNTPQEGVDSSPTQRLMGRRTKSTVPMTLHTLMPRGFDITDERNKMEAKRAIVAGRYTHRKEFPPLLIGDTVRIQPSGDKKEWQRGVVTDRTGPRSYIVNQGSRWMRRNRSHLRLSKEREEPHPPRNREGESQDLVANRETREDGERSDPDEANEETTTVVEDPGAENNEIRDEQPSVPTTTDGERRTRSGRAVRVPERLNL